MRDREDYTTVLEKLDLPVQVIVGEHDAITPPSVAEANYESLPARVSLTVIPGAGHLTPMENPPER
jgi:pimeloyl-ACP methyl ester carboxylesterase